MFDKKRVVVYLFVLIISISTVSAAKDFFMNVKPIKDKIEVDEAGIYNITITNLADTGKAFTVKFDDLIWDVYTQPLSAYFSGFDVPARSSETISVYLDPPDDVELRQYKVKLRIVDATGVEDSALLYVIVRPYAMIVGQYVPTVRANIDVTDNGELDPRKPASVYLTIDNLNPVNLTGLYIKLESSLFSQERYTSLWPLEQKTEVFNIQFNPEEPPKKDTIRITIYSGQDIVKYINRDINILAYSSLARDEKVKKQFLKTVRTITYTNDANVKRGEGVKEEIGFLQRLVTTTTPSSNIVHENGKTYLLWDIKLEPNEPTTIVIVKNYQYMVALVVLVILLIIAYFVFRSPLIIRKEAQIISTHEGGISELKILLYIKNRTRHQVKEVKVIDKTTKIAELQDEVIIGTLRPSKVLRHDKKGTLIEWEIPALEGWEERIICYKIKSKLSILGFFNLPSALLKYKGKSGETIVISSNKLRAAIKAA